MFINQIKKGGYTTSSMVGQTDIIKKICMIKNGFSVYTNKSKKIKGLIIGYKIGLIYI